MSRDEILNGNAGAEAQSNEILSILNEELQTAIRGLEFTSGNSRTQVSGRAISVQEGGGE